MGFFNRKESDMLKLVDLMSSLLARQDKVEKTQAQLVNRVNTLAEEWKAFKSSSLAVRMEHIEKVQKAQGATLEGYLKRMGSMHEDIVELYQTKISCPEGRETLNFGAWMDDIETRLKSVEGGQKQPAIKETYITPETTTESSAWTTYGQPEMLTPEDPMLFSSEELLKRKPRQLIKGKLQAQTWAQKFGKKEGPFIDTMRRLKIEGEQGRNSHRPRCRYLTPDEAKIIAKNTK